jgi:hypothetical protein
MKVIPELVMHTNLNIYVFISSQDWLFQSEKQVT